MPLAARITDLTHKGVIVDPVSTTVEIAGKMAARVGDGQVCKIHGFKPIRTGSSTVFIGGAAAARRGDDCICDARIVTSALTVDIGG
ncbi:MAG: PAAR domain-containing protein [Myxococcales bacterium]|nr:PAAR domain-containing protein [Myxococcales bacterium]